MNYHIISSSNFGVVGRPASRNTWIMASIRMTLFDYLAAGIPVLAYGHSTSYTKMFIEKYNTSAYIGPDDPNELAKGIYKNIEKLSK